MLMGIEIIMVQSLDRQSNFYSSYANDLVIICCIKPSYRAEPIKNLTQQLCYLFLGIRAQNKPKQNYDSTVQMEKKTPTKPYCYRGVSFLKEVKYLGVPLNSQLQWNFYAEKNQHQHIFASISIFGKKKECTIDDPLFFGSHWQKIYIVYLRFGRLVDRN